MHDKRKALETIIKKLGKLLPHLGNENDGEALNAARAITALDLGWRLPQCNGFDANHLRSLGRRRPSGFPLG
jgi:hypothetical protein